MANQVQSKNQNSNIELLCRVFSSINASMQSGTGSIATSSASINPQATVQGIIKPGQYSISTNSLQKSGLNIAVEEFMEPRPARKAVQHTYQGIFVDAYDVAPPMLTLVYAVEMPQATNFTTTSYFTANGNSSPSVQTNTTTATVNPGNLPTTSTTAISAKKTPNQQCKALSFVDILNLIYTATSQRNSFDNTYLYFNDYTRNAHHRISILNITYRAAVSRQNVLIAQVDAVVIDADSSISQTVTSIPSLYNNSPSTLGSVGAV